MQPNEETCVLCGATIPEPPDLPEYDPEHQYAHRCLCPVCAQKWPPPVAPVVRPDERPSGEGSGEDRGKDRDDGNDGEPTAIKGNLG